MKATIPAIKKNEQVFFISYIIFLSFSIMMHSFYYKYFAGMYKYIVLGCVFMLVGQELLNKTLSHNAVFGAAILFALTIFLIVQGHGDLQIAFACIFIYTFSARNIDFRKIGRITIIVTILLLIIVVLSSLAGIIPNYRTEADGRIRYYLGFRYVLNAPAFLYNVVLLETYVKGPKIKASKIAILCLVVVAFYMATNSRLSFYLSIVCLVFAVINKIRKDDFRELNLIPRLLIPVFIICTVASLWLTVTYSQNVLWMRSLNAFLGNRLGLGQKSLITYGVRLFGTNDIEWIGNGLDMYGERALGTYLYVDNLYIQVLQRYGILFLVIFLIFTTILMYQCYRKKENLLSILLALVAAHGLIDDTGLYLHFNTFWILFAPAAFGYLRQRRIEDMRGKRKKIVRLR